jgi:DNA repair exonuclease SbcCD ATPase subunit
MVSSIQELFDNVSTLYKEAKIRKQIQTKIVDNLCLEVSGLEAEELILEKTKAVFKHLIDSLVLEGAKKVENLLTYGLATVFEDQKLAVKVDLSEKRGLMQMEISLKDLSTGVEAPILGSFGGGPVAVVSFLLRVLSLLNLKLHKLLILDEAFSFVSENYVPQLAKLVSALCQKSNLDVLLVTHQRAFLEYADRAYQVAANGKLKSV